VLGPGREDGAAKVRGETVAVRGLSPNHMGPGELIGGELRTGFLIGPVIALLALPMRSVMLGDLHLAATVTLALAGNIVVAVACSAS
jgi:Mg/Co/Ni transporter MgtE